MRLIKAFALVAAIPFLGSGPVAAQSQVYNFVTIGGYPGYGSADGTNTAARFHFPTSVAADGAGNLYVADTSNSTIRKLTPVGTNWVSSTIAGSPGVVGSNDGADDAVQFAQPQGIAVDSLGNVFVADSGNNTIRELTLIGANWVSSTIVGAADYAGSADGTNNNALFFQPQGLAVDAVGNLYVADTQNLTIRKLTRVGTNWVSTTIAGTAGGYGNGDGTNDAVQFAYPEAVAVDPAGRVYVADTDNYTVRRLDPVGTNWVSSTIAGLAGKSGSTDGPNNAARFSFPYGVAVDGGTNVYVADTSNSTVRKLRPVGTNWVSSTIAGLTNTTGWVDGTNTAARFNRPYGVASGGAGVVFVADTGNNTIRELALVGTNWVTTTIAGLGGSTGSADGSNGAAQFNHPYGAVADGAGNLYVADSANNTIRKMTPVGTNWVTTTIAGLAGVADSVDGTNSAARFFGTNGITIDAGGDLYVADTVNSAIRKLTHYGTNWVSSTIAGLAGAPGWVDGSNQVARFANPWGIAVDSHTNLYVGDSWFSVIRKISPMGNNWVTRTIAGNTNYPTGQHTDGTNSAALFWTPDGIAVDAGGNVYVSDSENSTVRKLTPIGTNWVSSTIAGLAPFTGTTDGTNNNSRFYFPHGVAVDRATNVYVVDTSNDTIRKLTPVGTNWVSSTIGGLAGSRGIADGTDTDARFWGPAGIAADSNGTVYVLDTANNTVRRGAIWTPPPPVFQTVTLANGRIGFTWSASSGYAYQLQYNPDLGSISWTNLGSTITATNATASGSDAIGPGKQRSYRVMLLP